MKRLLKRLLLFCAGIVLGYVALCLSVGGPTLFTEEKTWLPGYSVQIISLNLTVQGVVVSLVASLCIGRALIPLKIVQESTGTSGSATESTTRGGGPVLPICATLFLLSAFLCFMIAQESAAHAERYSKKEHNQMEVLTAQTIGVIWLIVGGMLLFSPLLLKRHFWQLGWPIDVTGGVIAISGVALSGISLFAWTYHGNLIKGSDGFFSLLSLLGFLAGTIVTVLGGIKTVAGRTSSSQPWYVGADYISPVQNMLILGYRDGPTEGLLQCVDGHVYRFDLLAWEPQAHKVRVFALFPTAPTAWKQLSALCRGVDLPLPEQLRQSIDDILQQAGPVEWAVATEDFQGEILRVNALNPEELIQIRDWSGFLGLTQELHDVRPYPMTDRKSYDDTRIR